MLVSIQGTALSLLCFLLETVPNDFLHVLTFYYYTYLSRPQVQFGTLITSHFQNISSSIGI